MIDPPFITHACLERYAKTIRLLLAPGGKVLIATVLENAPLLKELLGVEVQNYLPSVPHLVYQARSPLHAAATMDGSLTGSRPHYMSAVLVVCELRVRAAEPDEPRVRGLIFNRMRSPHAFDACHSLVAAAGLRALDWERPASQPAVTIVRCCVRAAAHACAAAPQTFLRCARYKCRSEMAALHGLLCARCYTTCATINGFTAAVVGGRSIDSSHHTQRALLKSVC